MVTICVIQTITECILLLNQSNKSFCLLAYTVLVMNVNPTMYIHDVHTLHCAIKIKVEYTAKQTDYCVKKTIKMVNQYRE